MNRELIDAELEDRFRAALAEMMPHLVEDPARTIAVDTARAPRPELVGSGLRRPSPRPRRALAATAGLLAAAGIIGAVLAQSAQYDDSAAVPATTAADPTESTSPAPGTTSGSLLTTPVPSGDDPFVAMNLPGWIIVGYSDFAPVASVTPSARCAGCGAQRLVVTGSGPLFSAPIFTAWTIDDDYDISLYDNPVTIGTTPGRFIGTPGASTDASKNRVRIVWPIAPGRTAFVDASGFTDADVFAIAASLTFDSPMPTLPNPPTALVTITTPPQPATTRVRYINFDSGVKSVPGYDGTSSIEVLATNGGLQGMLDWRSPTNTPIAAGWTTRTIDAMTVSVDNDDATDASPTAILAISATWVVGGWAYEAIGHVFATEQDFLDAVAALQLTDPASFAAATAGVDPVPFGAATPSADGKAAIMP